MPKYLLAYHGGGMPEGEAAQAKEMAAWGAWFQKLGSAVVDGGNPVGASKTVSAAGAATDGGGANPITGYSVLQADSLQAAVKFAEGCPILASRGTVEVGETFDAM
ncbi:MAG: YciI family protein [Chloroflexi bacterium]|nr:YciI family protein [Chloroflexota bacterium]MDA1004554.1 YciI family protein [Chloroflexota bacterium]